MCTVAVSCAWPGFLRMKEGCRDQSTCWQIQCPPSGASMPLWRLTMLHRRIPCTKMHESYLRNYLRNSLVSSTQNPYSLPYKERHHVASSKLVPPNSKQISRNSPCHLSVPLPGLAQNSPWPSTKSWCGSICKHGDRKENLAAVTL